jgi:hypothetical protein
MILLIQLEIQMEKNQRVFRDSNTGVLQLVLTSCDGRQEIGSTHPAACYASDSVDHRSIWRGRAIGNDINYPDNLQLVMINAGNNETIRLYVGQIYAGNNRPPDARRRSIKERPDRRWVGSWMK